MKNQRPAEPSSASAPPTDLVEPAAVRFEFLGHGSSAHDAPPRQDRLYLDVGNELRPGVIDHHHLAAHGGCTAALVAAHPDLVLGAVNPGRKPNDAFTVVLHRDPDLDGVSSTYLSLAHLNTGRFPDGTDALVGYIERIDSGYPGLSQEQPFTLYAAYMVLAHRLGQRHWDGDQARWSQCVREGLQVVDYVTREAARRGLPVPDIDAFGCPGFFSPQDRAVVVTDLERYRRRLADPRTRARQVRLRLPGQLGGLKEVEALLVRNLHLGDGAERVVFFKDWARSDRDNCPNGVGFTGLSVYSDESAGRLRRGVISVTPESNTSLRGLGAILDRAEAEKRRQLHGRDDREEGPPRPGYRNSDPWYDGRAHGYQIIDAPRNGTVLSADEIEDLFLTFGRRRADEMEPLVLPAPDTDLPAGDDSAMHQLSAVVTAYQREYRPTPEGGPPDVFVSYPRARQAWVRQYVYEPLCAWRGPERIFFDQNSLAGGAGWLSTLAGNVKGCRVFLAVYCPEFFRSEFCEWELQLALLRDPTGKKRIVIPFMVERVQLPHYCELIQAELPALGRFTESMLGVLRTVLPEP